MRLSGGRWSWSRCWNPGGFRSGRLRWICWRNMLVRGRRHWRRGRGRRLLRFCGCCLLGAVLECYAVLQEGHDIGVQFRAATEGNPHLAHLSMLARGQIHKTCGRYGWRPLSCSTGLCTVKAQAMFFSQLHLVTIQHEHDSTHSPARSTSDEGQFSTNVIVDCFRHLCLITANRRDVSV